MTTEIWENQAPTTTIASTEATIRDFLQEHNEVEMILPVIVGLFVTSRFQLRGVNALLVNLAVASILRQVFRQLKNPESLSAQPQTTATTKTTSIQEQRYTIVHSVPGRIRLRVNNLDTDIAFASRLERLLNEEELVTSARLNRSANSVVINYQAVDLSDLDLGLRLMSILNAAEAE